MINKMCVHHCYKGSFVQLCLCSLMPVYGVKFISVDSNKVQLNVLTALLTYDV